MPHSKRLAVRSAAIAWLVALLTLNGCALAPTVNPEAPDEVLNVGRQPAPGSIASSPLDLEALRNDAEATIADLESNTDGEVYPAALQWSDPDDLTIAVALVDGRSFAVGQTEARFPLMSVSKPFTYALAVEQHGSDMMIERIGVSATGLPYNSVAAGAVRRTSEQNPMVNAGAISAHSFVEGVDAADKLKAVIDLYSRMANKPLGVEDAWIATPTALTFTLAYQMKAAERLEGDVDDTVDRYLTSNIVALRAEDLAQMGATLANGGVQPVSGDRVLAPETVRTVLSAMVTAGMYENSGLWWTRVGLPAKSGVSGAILAVAPGWGAIAAYSPRLDAAGNSVRGGLAIQALTTLWGLHSIDRLLWQR